MLYLPKTGLLATESSYEKIKYLFFSYNPQSYYEINMRAEKRCSFVKGSKMSARITQILLLDMIKKDRDY